MHNGNWHTLLVAKMRTEGMLLSEGLWSITRNLGIPYSLNFLKKGILKIKKLFVVRFFNVCHKTHQITGHPYITITDVLGH
jgi:hypothetical protein